MVDTCVGIDVVTLSCDAVRGTTRPAFRVTVPETYVKSRVPHFALNVPQISFSIIYSTILNFKI
jgi:hypothetical protein